MHYKLVLACCCTAKTLCMLPMFALGFPLFCHVCQTVRFFINETRRSLTRFKDVVDEDVW